MTLQRIKEERGACQQLRCENISQLLQRQGADFHSQLIYCVQFNCNEEEQALQSSKPSNFLFILTEGDTHPEI